MRNYYFAENGQQRGPFPPDQLAAQGLRPDTLVWAEGMAEWLRADEVTELGWVLMPKVPPPPAAPPGGYMPAAGYAANPPPIGYATHVGPYSPMPPNPSDANSKKIAAGICAILLGGFGIHKFILGYTTAGLIMLLSTVLTCGWGGLVMHVIGIIEGIIYLTKNDPQFYEEYMLRQKQWF